jgi:hypothetical protein
MIKKPVERINFFEILIADIIPKSNADDSIGKIIDTTVDDGNFEVKIKQVVAHHSTGYSYNQPYSGIYGNVFYAGEYGMYHEY